MVKQPGAPPEGCGMAQGEDDGEEEEEGGK